jgi:hypothetical protein
MFEFRLFDFGFAPAVPDKGPESAISRALIGQGFFIIAWRLALPPLRQDSRVPRLQPTPGHVCPAIRPEAQA